MLDKQKTIVIQLLQSMSFCKLRTRGKNHNYLYFRLNDLNNLLRNGLSLKYVEQCDNLRTGAKTTYSVNYKTK